MAVLFNSFYVYCLDYAVVLVLTSVMLFNMQHYVYASIIFVCGFINHHYKLVAYKAAKETTTKVVVKLMEQTGATSLIDLVDKLNQTENEDLSVDTKDKK